MENQIYVVFNRLANRYVQIFSFETDELMKARLSSKEANFNYDELEICKVGSYNISTGVLTPIPPTRIDIPHKEMSVEQMAAEVK